MRFLLGLLGPICAAFAQPNPPSPFKVLAFYTGKEDQAHISFVHEANLWFPEQGRAHGFTYEATTDWTELNRAKLKDYRVVMFLDTRPEVPAQRQAFEQYMENGGGWMGFHFSAFALPDSKYPSNWDWYHRHFLGSGSYRSNTWRPTSAILKVESPLHPTSQGLPPTFRSAPNEWYRWDGDLRSNPDIQVLISIDSSSFPLGTGPNPEEIWHSGDYPVAWTNRLYHMVYLNMGHNDLDYRHHPPLALSSTFSSPEQNQLIIHTLEWVGSRQY